MSNITSVRMMDPKSSALRDAVADWEEHKKRYNGAFSDRISPDHIKVMIERLVAIRE